MHLRDFLFSPSSACTCFRPFRDLPPILHSCFEKICLGNGARKDSPMNRFAFVRNLLLSLLVVLATASLASAQIGTTSLRGTVFDKSGAAISGADVTLSNVHSGVARTTVTGPSGGY